MKLETININVTLKEPSTIKHDPTKEPQNDAKLEQLAFDFIEYVEVLGGNAEDFIFF